MKRNLVVKIKYRGTWRKVVGMSYDNGLAYYMAQTEDKLGYQPVFIRDKEITDKKEQFRCHYPSAKRKSRN